MSVWQSTSSASALSGSEGELVSVSISVEPRELESLLEALARVDFPVNPQIYHAEGQGPDARTIVVFPAYAGGLPQVRAELAAAGQESASIQVKGMLQEIQSLLGHEADDRRQDTR
jgi:hypothetical protein